MEQAPRDFRDDLLELRGEVHQLRSIVRWSLSGILGLSALSLLYALTTIPKIYQIAEEMLPGVPLHPVVNLVFDLQELTAVTMPLVALGGVLSIIRMFRKRVDGEWGVMAVILFFSALTVLILIVLAIPFQTVITGLNYQ